jgi:NADPH-dependent 2,4-dienoyl-CoA reductase/sulfur reductase-like enzyme
MSALGPANADTVIVRSDREHPGFAAAFDPLPVPALASTAAALELREHIVIVGGGFGGLSAALVLRHVPVQVT